MLIDLAVTTPGGGARRFLWLVVKSLLIQLFIRSMTTDSPVTASNVVDIVKLKGRTQFLQNLSLSEWATVSLSELNFGENNMKIIPHEEWTEGSCQTHVALVSSPLEPSVKWCHFVHLKLLSTFLLKRHCHCLLVIKNNEHYCHSPHYPFMPNCRGFSFMFVCGLYISFSFSILKGNYGGFHYISHYTLKAHISFHFCV